MNIMHLLSILLRYSLLLILLVVFNSKADIDKLLHLENIHLNNLGRYSNENKPINLDVIYKLKDIDDDNHFNYIKVYSKEKEPVLITEVSVENETCVIYPKRGLLKEYLSHHEFYFIVDCEFKLILINTDRGLKIYEIKRLL